MRHFVVGHPRSGTRLVAELLNAGSAQVAGHEVLAAVAPESLELASAFYEGHAARSTVESMLRRYPATPRIDCNWKLTWILPLVLETHPEARVVHLVREPRANVRSCVELDYYGATVHHPEYQDDAERNRWLRSLPRLRSDGWDALSLVERNAAFWLETHRLIEAALAGRPCLRVRLEDLDEPRVRAQLFSFLDVAPPEEAALARVLATPLNDKRGEKEAVARLRPRRWLAADDAAVWRLCGERAAALGYSA